MGTNYYLMKKAKFNPLSDNIDEHYSDITPHQLVNGWLWKNKYYATLENLNDDYEIELHIGKSSAGWKFLLCSYNELNLKSLEDWQDIWSQEDVRIKDEYEDTITASELLDVINRTVYKELYPDRELQSRGPDSQIISSHDTYEITSLKGFS